MVLARPVYSSNGTRLLQEGATLKEKYIPKIKELGYNAVYIQDELLEDVEVNDLINEELKREAVEEIKDTFKKVDNKVSLENQVDDIKSVLNKIMEDVLDRKNSIVDIIDMKMYNEYLFHHSVNVAILSMIVGMSMGFNSYDLYKLGLGALLHDVGKLEISNDILNKEGKLTEEEYEQVKTHSQQGYEKLKDQEQIPSTAKIVILQHHERYNGEGYPNGKAGEDIHVFSRIVSVVDVFDALISDRPYRKGVVPSEAMEYILGGAGSLFDKRVVGHFFKKVAAFPVGSEVVLNDGRQGLVIENFESYSLRPRVRIIKEKGQDIQPYDIDLRETKYNKVTIVKVAEGEAEQSNFSQEATG